MNADTIRGLLKDVPFRPFSIHYKTGQVFRVTDADDAWVPPIPGTTSVYVADKKGSFSVLNASWIVEVAVSKTERRRRKAG